MVKLTPERANARRYRTLFHRRDGSHSLSAILGDDGNGDQVAVEKIRQGKTKPK